TCGPTDQNRVGTDNKSSNTEVCEPPVALSVSDGKNAALAMPICSFAAPTSLSAAAISGLRSSSFEGIPASVDGGGDWLGNFEIESSDGGFPSSAAMACSSSDL